MSLSERERQSVLTATDCLNKINQMQDLLKIVIEVSNAFTLENCERIQLVSELYLTFTEAHFEALGIELTKLRQSSSS